MCLVGLACVATVEARQSQAPTHTVAEPPSVVVRSANVTSLEAHWDELVEEHWDLLFVQEPRVPTDSWVFRSAAAKHIQAFPGPRTPQGDLLARAF